MVIDNAEKDVAETPELLRLRHGLIKDITQRLESFNLNTVISAFMEYNNKFVDLTKSTGVDKETLKTMVKLIAPFAPHIGEELWEVLGGTDSVFHTEWPEFDEAHLKADTITLPVQVSGKTRVTVDVPATDFNSPSVISIIRRGYMIFLRKYNDHGHTEYIWMNIMTAAGRNIFG